MALTVEDVMSREVATCRPFDTLRDAAARMAREDLDCLPVVASDASARVIGMLTDRDISLAAARDVGVGELQVRAAMSVGLVRCAPGDRVADALATMAGAGVSRLPVVDRDGRLAGVFSLCDVATAVTAGREGLDASSPREVCRALARGARARQERRVDPGERANAGGTR